MIVLAVRDSVVPTQTGPLLPAVGADGVVFIVTVTLTLAELSHPLTVWLAQ